MSYLAAIKSINTEADYWVFFQDHPELRDRYPADSDGKILYAEYGVCPIHHLMDYLSYAEQSALASAAKRAADNTAKLEADHEREMELEEAERDALYKIMVDAFNAGDPRVQRSKGGNGDVVIFAPGVVTGRRDLSGIIRFARQQLTESGLLM